MAQFALAWILQSPAVSVVIPGARNAAQAKANAAASDVPALPEETMAELADVYERLIKVHVHQKW
jgi:aryl-alcohol dehydrogenase-like predicted oxidoreductase